MNLQRNFKSPAISHETHYKLNEVRVMGVCEHISLPEHLLLSKHKRVPCYVPKKEANLQSEQLPTPNNSERENSE